MFLLARKQRSSAKGLRFSAPVQACAIVLAAAFAGPPVTAQAALENDYPTEAIADYVFGCMKANGETREALIACSCSVDVVASILPYERYEAASTFLSMQQTQGERSALYRDNAESRAAIQDLRRAQVEGEIRCFKGG